MRIGCKSQVGQMVVFRWLVCLAVSLAPHWRIHHDAACQHSVCSFVRESPLRLKPVIKRTLADTSLVNLVGSYGNPFVENCRYGRCGGTWFRSAGWFLARRLRCDRVLRFHGFPPMSSITHQIGDGKARLSVRRCQGSQARVGWRE